MTTNKYVPRRGDIINLDFHPQKGHEQKGRRPAVVLSPADYNRAVGLAVVCPITNQTKGYSFEVPLPENDFVSGVALADQIKSIDWKERRAEFVCSSAADFLEDVVDKAIALISPDEDE